MNTTTTNGRPRKQLADQIDRLETTVSNLGEDLRATVREATAGAVQEAIGGILREILLNPDIANLLRAAQASAIPPSTIPAPSRSPSLLARLRSWAASLASRARSALQMVRNQTAILLAGLGAVLAGLAIWKAGPLLAGLAWLGGKVAALACAGCAVLRAAVAF